MYTHGARPELFQDKLAPIQINFLGYPGTSGNNNYDYIVADQNLISSKQYQYYTEKLFLCLIHINLIHLKIIQFGKQKEKI